MTTRRTAALGVLAAAFLPLAGCATRLPLSTNASGQYCHRPSNRSRTRTCMLEPIPSAAVDAEAKRFEATPGAVMLYIVRNRWGDPVNQVAVSIDGRSLTTTVPESLVRARLTPGEHELVASWEGGTARTLVEGAAGEIVVVELIGSVWAWRSDYHWGRSSAYTARRRALRSRLVADITRAG